MSKIMIIPNSIDMIQQTSSKVNAYLIGVKNLSINLPITFTMEEIKVIDDICQKNQKELFISLNRNMFNEDMEPLKEILFKLKEYRVKGMFFYDIALVNLKKKYHLPFDLVWSQEHFTTNYETINYWFDKGVTYTQISNEITLQEILQIKENTKSKLIVPVFGYIPMFASHRKLVKNYKKYFHLNDNSHIYYMKDTEEYPIIEDQNGTYVYYSKILNGKKYLPELQKANIDYVLLNSFLIDNFKDVLDIFLDQDSNIEIEKILKQPCDDGFFEKKTIYKVK